MTMRIAALLVLVLCPLAAADGLEVHEWGFLTQSSGLHARALIDQLPRQMPSLRTWGEGERALRAPDAAFLAAMVGAFTPTRTPRTTQPFMRGGGDPFVYFHADVATRVAVDVRFPGGVPVAWWPRAEVREDGLRWRKVEVLPRSARDRLHDWGDVRHPDAPAYRRLLDARAVQASPIRVQGTTERYLTYDGPTREEPELLLRRVLWDGLHLTNVGQAGLTDLLVFAPGSSRPVRIAALAPGQTRVVPHGAEGPSPVGATELAALGLARGLFADEARAFGAGIARTGILGAPGVRVLFPIPRATWDRLYPLRVTPTPARTVRVGMMLCFGPEHVASRLLAGTIVDRSARRVYTAQLVGILKGRVERLEPLSPVLRRALTLDHPDLATLRRRIGSAPLDAQARVIERVIDRSPDHPRLSAMMRAYLYGAGQDPSFTMRTWLATRERPPLTWNELLFCCPVTQ